MVWIVTLVVAWIVADLLLVGLAIAASRGDRPTREHAAARLRLVRRPPA